MKRIAVCLLALLMVVSLVSCGGNDDAVPAGYQRASDADVCESHLYVPDTWIAKSGPAQNFTSATVASGDKCNVSVMRVDSVTAETVGDYWKEQQSEYAVLLGPITPIEEGGKVTLGNGEGKVNGHRYVFTAKHTVGEKSTDYKIMQIFFLKNSPKN